MSKKIIVTGGDGRFAQVLKQTKSNYNFIYRNKNQLNILSMKSIEKNIKSLNLFQNKLNYQVFKKVKVFEEVHLDLKVNSDNTVVDNMLGAVQCQIAEDIPTDKLDIQQNM